MQPFLAMIMPVDSGNKPDQGLPPGQGGRPDQGLPGSQPGIDNTLPGDIPRPEHPIFYPLPPGAVPPRPDQGLPGAQPEPGHPIALPPGNGGWLPVYIDNTLPGDQPKPDQGLPGSQPKPDQGLPGGQGGRPTHPIVLPPEGENPPGEVKWVAGWTPVTGWVTVGIIVPENPVPTPSKRR